MSSKLCAYFPIFDDLDCLKFTIKKTFEYGIDTIILIDGKFKGFPANHDNSRDGIIEWVKDFKDKIIYRQMGECLEQEKLNLAFHIAAQNGFKYVLLLGADEWPEGDINLFYSALESRYSNSEYPMMAFIAVKTWRPNNKWNRDEDQSPKIFINPMWIRARFTHWLYYFMGTNIPFSLWDRMVPGITIHHDDDLRPKKRNELMEKYQDWNVPREQFMASRAHEARP